MNSISEPSFFFSWRWKEEEIILWLLFPIVYCGLVCLGFLGGVFKSVEQFPVVDSLAVASEKPHSIRPAWGKAQSDYTCQTEVSGEPVATPVVYGELIGFEADIRGVSYNCQPWLAFTVSSSSTQHCGKYWGLICSMNLYANCNLVGRINSVAQSCLTLRPHGLQHARIPCPSNNSQSLLKLMSNELVMPSNHLILHRPLLLLPSIFPCTTVFSNESVLCIRWPKYWRFSFSISPSNEYLGLIPFRMDWFDLLTVQETLKILLQHHSSKASILRHSAFFMVQLSHPYMITG